MFGGGLHFHLKDLFAVRGVAVAARSFRARGDGTGALVFHTFGWNWYRGGCSGWPYRWRARSPGGVLSDKTRSRAPPAESRRVAGDGRYLHRLRARAPPGSVQRKAGRGATAWRRRPESPALKLGGFIAFTLLAGSRLIRGVEQSRRDALARTVHPQRAGHRAGDRRRLGVFLRRLDGAGAFLAGVGWGSRNSAHARAPKRCRYATPSP